MDDISPFEPSVLSAAWRYRWLVLGIIAVLTALAVAYAVNTPEQWVTTASLVVEDPQAGQVFDQGGLQRPERYVEDQVAVIESPLIAARAAEIVAASDSGFTPSTEDILDARTVGADPSSNLIVIAVEGDDPIEAMAIANALATAYTEFRSASAVAGFEVALAELDRSIAAADAELETTQAAIVTWTDENPAVVSLEGQFEDIMARLVELQEPDPGATEEEVEAKRVELTQIFLQLQTLQLIRNLLGEDPELSVLLDRQQEAFERRGQLAARRDQIDVDAQLASDGVVLYSEAQFVTASGSDVARTVAVAIVLGGLLGVGLAYFLALRYRRSVHRSDPELVLGVPLFAEVPDFSEERGNRTPLPVQDAPASASAEAFRFAAAAIDIQHGSVTVDRGGLEHARDPVDVQPGSFVITSAARGDGKTVVTANTALAAARRGARVLVVDADFGDAGLTRLLIGPFPPDVGLTEVVEKGVPLAEATLRYTVTDGVTIDILARGREPVSAAEFFRSAGVGDILDFATSEYDLVLVDTPSLLEVAYTSSLVSLVDRVIVVVPHQSPVQLLEDEQDRLEFIGTPRSGYIYNKVPLRPEMKRGQGSITDLQGTKQR